MIIKLYENGFDEGYALAKEEAEDRAREQK